MPKRTAQELHTSPMYYVVMKVEQNLRPWTIGTDEEPVDLFGWLPYVPQDGEVVRIRNGRYEMLSDPSAEFAIRMRPWAPTVYLHARAADDASWTIAKHAASG